jgi:hypothetical protein
MFLPGDFVDDSYHMGVVDFMDMRQGFGEWYVQWTDGCNETFTSPGILTYSENELSHVNLQHLNFYERAEMRALHRQVSNGPPPLLPF